MDDDVTNSTNGPQADVGCSYGTSTTDSGGWNPSGVQDMIDYQIQQAVLMLQNHQDPSFVMNYIFFLMQEYGMQVMGQQSDAQSTMNGYFSGIQAAWNAVHQAHTGDNTANTTAFTAALYNMEQQALSDPFFKENADNESMLVEITGNLQSLVNLVADPPPTVNGQTIPGSDALYKIWVQDDPSIAGLTGQGNTSTMDQLNQSMAQVNQQFTGESQAVGAITQNDAKNQQAEQDSFNNFQKSLSKIMSYFNQNQQTH